MMKGRERGMRSPFAMRAGINLRRWRGTNTLGDASSCADDEFRALENVEHDGSKWNSRDGLTKVNSAAAMTGSIYGIWDEGDGGGGGSGLGLGGPVRLYGGVNNNAANLIYAYDSGMSTVGQQLKVNPAESSFGAMLALHEEFAQLLPTPLQAASEETGADNEARILLGGTNGKVYMWRPPFIPQGKALIDVAPTPRLLFQCAGLADSDDITSFAFDAGILFIASDDGTGVKIFSFDGQAVTLEDTIASVDTGILAAWHGEIYCALNAQAIRRRDATGAWSSLTFPGTVTGYIPRQILEYGANLYFAGQDGSGGTGEILKWDGTTLTTERSIAGDTSILAMEVFDDKLCYLHSDTAIVAPTFNTMWWEWWSGGWTFVEFTGSAINQVFNKITKFPMPAGRNTHTKRGEPVYLTVTGWPMVVINEYRDSVTGDRYAVVWQGGNPSTAATWKAEVQTSSGVIGNTNTVGIISGARAETSGAVWFCSSKGYVDSNVAPPWQTPEITTYKWDGTTLSSEDVYSPTGESDGYRQQQCGADLWAFGQQLLQFVGGTRGWAGAYAGGSWYCRFRAKSAADAWTTVTLPATMATQPGYGFRATAAVEFNSKLYLGGGGNDSGWGLNVGDYDNVIMSWDGGGSLTQEHRVGGGNTGGNGQGTTITEMFVYNSALYYIYNDNAIGAGQPTLGMYDGSTWTDILVNFRSKIATYTFVGGWTAIVRQSDGKPYLTMMRATGAGTHNGTAVISPDTTDLSGAWSVEAETATKAATGPQSIHTALNDKYVFFEVA